MNDKSPGADMGPQGQPGGGKAVKKMSDIEKLRTELTKMEGQFKMALPEHVTTERFTRNLITAVQDNPDLLGCDRRSLFQAAMTAAQLGLMVGSALGHAYIIPFKVKQKSGKVINTATFIPGYRGYINLAHNSGEIQSLSAYEVCKNDEFEYELGLDPKLVHRPALGDRGDIIFVYCAVRYKDGGEHIEVMTTQDVEKIRARSKAPKSPAWQNDWMMMARKTVIRRAAKYLPLSIQRLAALDAAYEFQGKGGRIDLEGGLIIEGEATHVEPESQDPQPEQIQDQTAQKTKTQSKSKAKPKEEPSEPEPKQEEPAQEPAEAEETQEPEPEPEPEQEPKATPAPQMDLDDELAEFG